MNPRDQRVDVLGALDAVLEDGRFIAAETGDEIARDRPMAQPLRHAPQELVADQMPQRIVDAFELVDVDVEDCDSRPSAFSSNPRRGAETASVRQIGQAS
jgi:hypothetical protein